MAFLLSLVLPHCSGSAGAHGTNRTIRPHCTNRMQSPNRGLNFAERFDSPAA